MSTVTIGFFPREHFSLAAESLQRIFEYTHIPFNLIVVDCKTPEIYWHQIEEVLRDHSNVKVIRTEHYLMPNQSRNRVIQESNDDFICFIENDILVEAGWLTHLIEACEKHPADVAIPRIFEGQSGDTKIHWDRGFGEMHSVQTENGLKWQITPATGVICRDQGSHRRKVELWGEPHCELYRRSVFDRVDPFDEQIVCLDFMDSNLALYQSQISVVFEPKSIVRICPLFPPRLLHSLDYYLKR
jgi:hypothetical protein